MPARSAARASLATKAAVKAFLIAIKWSEAAAGTISEDEIDTKELLPFLTVTNISKLCSITRKPGGGDAGHKVSMIAEDNLQLSVYWIRHRIRISRTWDLTHITPSILSLMSQQRDLEGQIPEAPSPPVIDVNDWPKAFELICEHLDQHRGLNGNRLSYCVRPHLQVTPSADEPSSDYAALDLEMIA